MYNVYTDILYALQYTRFVAGQGHLYRVPQAEADIIISCRKTAR